MTSKTTPLSRTALARSASEVMAWLPAEVVSMNIPLAMAGEV
ncbi:MAG: hypothetical protein WDA72_00100 [Desulfomonilia bacterium]|jgi:hypothetical protein|nr:hypothetical protein [Desulfomonilia bacterium]HPW68228.1 hypothetical protein [Deltaproteobacteria bacterium]